MARRAGIRIKNASGSMQIDDNFAAQVVRYQGVSATSAWPGPTPNPLQRAVIAVNTTQPLMAFRTDSPATMFYAGHDGSNWNFTFQMNGSASENIEWWALDAAGTVAVPENFGLLIKKGGVVKFHNGMKIGRIVDIIEIDALPEDPNAGPFEHSAFRSYTPGRKYAVIMANISRFESLTISEVIPGPTPIGEKWMQFGNYVTGAMFIDHELIVTLRQFERYIQTYPNSTPEHAVSVGQTTILVIDVTGY